MHPISDQKQSAQFCYNWLKMFYLKHMPQYDEDSSEKDVSFQHSYFGFPRRKDLNDGSKCPS